MREREGMDGGIETQSANAQHWSVWWLCTYALRFLCSSPSMSAVKNNIVLHKPPAGYFNKKKLKRWPKPTYSRMHIVPKHTLMDATSNRPKHDKTQTPQHEIIKSYRSLCCSNADAVRTKGSYLLPGSQELLLLLSPRGSEEIQCVAYLITHYCVTGFIVLGVLFVSRDLSLTEHLSAEANYIACHSPLNLLYVYLHKIQWPCPCWP